MQADFALDRIKLVEVAGRVMGVDGAPESRAFVRLSAAAVEDWFTGLGTSTDSKGDFSIKGVPPGNHHITASSAGFLQKDSPKGLFENSFN